MSKNKESPKHGSLSSPIERPNDPVVNIRSGGGEAEDDDYISDDIAHRPPWVLDPAMLGDGSADLGEIERRRRPWIKTRFLGVLLLYFFFLWKSNTERNAHLQTPISMSRGD